MKLDLKDAFFSVPITEELQTKFAFQWGTRRFCWTRLPQGWKWSSILFHETVADILCRTGVVNYTDDVLLGAPDPKALLEMVEEVFGWLQKFSLKLNF